VILSKNNPDFISGTSRATVVKLYAQAVNIKTSLGLRMTNNSQMGVIHLQND